MPTVRADEILVVAALDLEVAHITRDVEVLVTGVGKSAAAGGLAKRLARGPTPALVVNVGTAGSVVTDISGVHEVGYITQHDFPYAAIEILLSEPLRRGYVLDPSLPPRPADGAPEAAVTLASADTFVSDATSAARIASGGVHLVDMEAYSFATVCAAFDVPLRCGKAVSDNADETAGVTWLEAVDACAAALSAWLDSEVLGR